MDPRPDLFNLISFFLLFSANSFALADSAFRLPLNPGRGVEGVLRWLPVYDFLPEARLGDDSESDEPEPSLSSSLDSESLEGLAA